MHLIELLINKTLLGTGDSDKHLMTLFSLAISINSRNILELGTRKGVTTLPLLIAAKLKNARLTSVDIEQTTYIPPDELKDNWTFIKSDAIEFLEQNKTHYDLVYIDDWHDGLHVQKEINLLEKYIDKSSLVILHDLMYNNTQPNYNKDMAGVTINKGQRKITLGNGEFANGGPFFAVNSLDKEIWEWATIPVNNGLTILRKKI